MLRRERVIYQNGELKAWTRSIPMQEEVTFTLTLASLLSYFFFNLFFFFFIHAYISDNQVQQFARVSLWAPFFTIYPFVMVFFFWYGFVLVVT